MRFGYAMALSGLVWAAITYAAVGCSTGALVCLVGSGACVALARCEVPWWVKVVVAGALFDRRRK